MTQAASRKDSRNFGLLVGGVFSVIGLWPALVRGLDLRLWAVVVGGLLVVGGVISPTLLSPFYKVWMRVGHVLGWINTRILLSIVFYVIVTPIAILFRLMGKDTMRQAFSEGSPTYRVDREPRLRSHMKNQF